MKVNNLEQTAYMIDKSGEVHKGIEDKYLGYIHPYIYLPDNLDLTELYTETERCIEDFIWLYIHTNNEEIKNKILQNVQVIYDKDFITRHFSYSGQIDKITDQRFIDNYIEIAMNLLQEFLPCRYGGEFLPDNEYGEIYFRVTSTGFNWFNIIWNFVYSHKNEINNITIERDKTRTGSKELYRNGQHTFNHMPVEEFIMLKGNPVIESTNTTITGNPKVKLHTFKRNLLKEELNWGLTK